MVYELSPGHEPPVPGIEQEHERQVGLPADGQVKVRVHDDDEVAHGEGGQGGGRRQRHLQFLRVEQKLCCLLVARLLIRGISSFLFEFNICILKGK